MELSTKQAKLFDDIRSSAAQVRSYLGTSTFRDYRGDSLTKAAVERRLLIVSEAAINLGNAAEAFCPGHEWNKLRALGDEIEHRYYAVDDTTMWQTATVDLPALLNDVTAMLTRNCADVSILRSSR